MIKISSLNFRQSKYLVERTGLGAELDLIESFIGQPLDAVIDKLISSTAKNNIPPPTFLTPSKWNSTRKAFIKNNKKSEVGKLNKKERNAIRQWGLKNLLETKNPLHERMVWFWMNHFTSSAKSVKPITWMMQREQSIRKHALGNFSDILKTMSFDPAMLIYLNGKSNRKGKPNENFARELLELFTLGEGNYTEQDVKEAARAFTGWRVNNSKNTVVFQKKYHDFGVKTFMGNTGKFNGEDILDILLKNPRTAEFISTKLWHEFVTTHSPEPAVIKQWGEILINSKYDISALLKIVFSSDAFWHEKYRGTLIKSPIDLVVGTLRTLDVEDNGLNLNAYLKQLKLMGQHLYTPPNVKGWEGGKTWINDDTLLRRQRFLQRILRGQTGANKKKTKGKMAENKNTKTSAANTMMSKNNDLMNVGQYELPELSEQQWADWLLPIPPITLINEKSQKARLSAILLDPAYQLK